MSVTNYEELKCHIGHKVECVSYGKDDNIAVECMDCNEVLMSFDKGNEVEDNSMHLGEEFNMDWNKVTKELEKKMEEVMIQFAEDNKITNPYDVDGDVAEDMGTLLKCYANYLAGNYNNAELEELNEKTGIGIM